MPIKVEYLILAAIVLVGYIIYRRINKIRKDKKMRKTLANQWGSIPQKQLKPEELRYISEYHRWKLSNEPSAFSIDEITWNDLDMDSCFERLNNTQTSVGEEYLYSLLHELQFDMDVISERDRLIRYFQDNPGERIQLQMALSAIGKRRGVLIPENFFGDERHSIWGSVKYLGMAALFPLSILLAFINPPLGIILTAASLLMNIRTYYNFKNNTSGRLEALSHAVNLVTTAKKLCRTPIKGLEKYYKLLSKASDKFRGASFNSFYLLFYRTEDVQLEYLKVVLLGELIAYEKINRLFCRLKGELKVIYETIGLLDALLAAASYRESLDTWCKPSLSSSDEPFIHFDGIYHPLLSKPVANSLELKSSILVTGSNASGKSTFLKTVAINGIFAQTIATCLAASYSSAFFRIYTSMALKDNIQSNESYYITEIKSLKRILDNSCGPIPTLCIIDEVLRGTNTIERIAASSELLYSLSRRNVLCIAATHDIELTTILDCYFENYHFQEYVNDNEVTFDYTIYPGRSNTRNAIKLLRLMGYDEGIVTAADERAHRFMETGTWQKIRGNQIMPRGQIMA